MPMQRSTARPRRTRGDHADGAPSVEQAVAVARHGALDHLEAHELRA